MHCVTLGPGSKQDHSDFSFTQEEFSADVFWGESPPVDDVPDIFDGRYKKIKLCSLLNLLCLANTNVHV